MYIYSGIKNSFDHIMLIEIDKDRPSAKASIFYCQRSKQSNHIKDFIYYNYYFVSDSTKYTKPTLTHK